MMREIREEVARLKRAVEAMLKNPELSWAAKLCFLVMLAPVAFVGGAVYGARHYPARALRRIRRGGKS
jgi:hypothetical protein